MQKVYIFIDGYNFYFSIKRSGVKIDLGWCDFQKLGNLFIENLKMSANLEKIKYFTARVGIHGQQHEIDKQNLWLKALSSIKTLEKIYGLHTGEAPRDKREPRKYRTEKQTDVNIAVNMLIDAKESNFDRAMLVCGDTDQLPSAIALARTFGKDVDIWLPPGCENNLDSWKKETFYYRSKISVNNITVDMLSKARLPDEINCDGELILWESYKKILNEKH